MSAHISFDLVSNRAMGEEWKLEKVPLPMFLRYCKHEGCMQVLIVDAELSQSQLPRPGKRQSCSDQDPSL
jgi:hypothetical protein